MVFVAGSAACALSWSPAVLVLARALQGLGSALLSPAALALLTLLSEPGAVRRRAVGWWTAAAAGGGASGWVLGGLFTEYLGWRTVFWVNVPIGLAALAAAAGVLPTGRRRRGTRLDLPGAVAVTIVLGLLVFGLTNTAERGLLRTPSWAGLALAAGGTALLVRHLRRPTDPLVPLALLRSREVAGANVTALLLTATTSPAMYLCALYVQEALRLSPARASLLFPVLNVAVIAGSAVGPVLLRRYGARRALLAGFTGIGAGTALCATLPGDGLPLGHLLGAFALMGIGLGGASVASTHVGTTAADPAYQGVASGVLGSAAQVGTALGLAVVAPLASSAGAADMGAYRAGFLGTCALAATGLVASLLVRSDGGRRSGTRAPRDVRDRVPSAVPTPVGTTQSKTDP